MALAYNSKISELPIYPVTLSGIELYPIAYLEKGVLANDADKYNVYKTNTNLLSAYIAQNLKFDNIASSLDNIYNTLTPLDKDIRTSYGALWEDAKSNKITAYNKIGAVMTTYNNAISTYHSLRTYIENYKNNFYITGATEADGFYITYNNNKFKAVPLATDTTYGLLTYNLLKNTLSNILVVDKASENVQGVISYTYIRNIASSTHHKVNINKKTVSNDLYLTYNLDDYSNPPTYSGDTKIERAKFGTAGTTTLSYLNKFAQDNLGPAQEFNPTYFDLRSETSTVEYNYPTMSGNTYGATTYNKIQEIAKKSNSKHSIKGTYEQTASKLALKLTANNKEVSKDVPKATDTTYGVVNGNYVYTLAEENVAGRTSGGLSISNGVNGKVWNYTDVYTYAYGVAHNPSVRFEQNSSGVYTYFGIDGVEFAIIPIPPAGTLWGDVTAGVINSTMIDNQAQTVISNLPAGTKEDLKDSIYWANDYKLTLQLNSKRGNTTYSYTSSIVFPKIDDNDISASIKTLVSRDSLKTIIYNTINNNKYIIRSNLKFKLNSSVTDPKFYLYSTLLVAKSGTVASGTTLEVPAIVLTYALQKHGITRLITSSLPITGQYSSGKLNPVSPYDPTTENGDDVISTLDLRYLTLNPGMASEIIKNWKI